MKEMQKDRPAHRGLTLRDLISGLLIVLLAGLLVGQQLGLRARTAPTPAAAVPAGLTPAAVPGGIPNGAMLPTAPTTPVNAATRRQLREAGDSFAQIAEQVTPSVVNINSTRIVPGRTFIDPWQQMMGGDGLSQEPDRRMDSLGSGVIVSPDGYVVTNNHNIDGASEIRVSLGDGRDFAAEVVGRDSLSDVAVLKIEGTHLPYTEWGDSDSLRVGEWVIAIGNPFGFSQTVTAGIVSAKGRNDVGISDFEDFIQTDAAINPGNSGGALIDIDGRLIGINTAIFSRTGGYEGIGFAIPAKVARSVAEQLVTQGKVVRGWIGVIGRQLTDDTAAKLGLRTTDGVLVWRMYRDQPADQAGIVPGDIIVKVGEQLVNTPRELRLAVADAPVGRPLTFTLKRQAATRQVRVNITEHPVRRDGTAVPGI